MLKNKIILITGGTGSFGNAAARRFLREGASEIRIFSRDENKQEQMRLAFDDDRLKFFIGDIRDYESVYDALLNVDFVFHAAALKQVPSCEFYPMEAVKTNVLGAENVVRASIARSVKCCVLLSTDKAVYPINAMGISKAMMEKMMIANSRGCEQTGTILCATRYGNVMGSRGSVIPLFISQISGGNSITLTDINMTRFLMSLEESVDLVMFAFSNAKPGDIFVQKAPSCTIGNLATAILELMDCKIEPQIIGTRHGEKLFESLISREEMVHAIDCGKYFRIPSDARTMNYKKYFVEGEIELSDYSDYTSHNAILLEVSEIKRLLINNGLIDWNKNAKT
jgi:UDP-glucose 4-epimerase